MHAVLTLLFFLVMMSVLVAAHELGHYQWARLFKMDVEEFAIGFGKKLWVWMRRGDTEFTIRAVPLGGFVRIRGMVPQEDGGETEIQGGFYRSAPFARFIVLLAGPVYSLLAGWLLLVGLFATTGVGGMNPEPVVGGILKDGVAYTAGLREGDRVKSIDGKPVATWYEMLSYVRDRAGQELTVAYERNGQPATLKVTPREDTAPTPVMGPDFQPTGESRKQGKLGITPGKVYGVGPSVKAANDTLVGVFGALGRLVMKPAELKENLSGPVGIVQATSQATANGYEQMVSLAAMLSISLGIFNLLPVPPLDGGQMMVALIEMFRRGRRLSFGMQNAIATVGLSLIGLLFVFVLTQDIVRLVNPPKPPVETKAP